MSAVWFETAWGFSGKTGCKGLFIHCRSYKNRKLKKKTCGEKTLKKELPVDFFFNNFKRGSKIRRGRNAMLTTKLTSLPDRSFYETAIIMGQRNQPKSLSRREKVERQRVLGRKTFDSKLVRKSSAYSNMGWGWGGAGGGGGGRGYQWDQLNWWSPSKWCTACLPAPLCSHVGPSVWWCWHDD